MGMLNLQIHYMCLIFREVDLCVCVGGWCIWTLLLGCLQHKHSSEQTMLCKVSYLFYFCQNIESLPGEHSLKSK